MYEENEIIVLDSSSDDDIESPPPSTSSLLQYIKSQVEKAMAKLIAKFDLVPKNLSAESSSKKSKKRKRKRRHHETEKNDDNRHGHNLRPRKFARYSNSTSSFDAPSTPKKPSGKIKNLLFFTSAFYCLFEKKCLQFYL